MRDSSLIEPSVHDELSRVADLIALRVKYGPPNDDAMRTENEGHWEDSAFVYQPTIRFSCHVGSSRTYSVDMSLTRSFGMPAYQFTNPDVWIHEFIEYTFTSLLQEQREHNWLFNMTIPHLMASLVTDSGYLREGEDDVTQLTPDEFWVQFRKYIQRMKELD